ncbi:MAG: Hsp20/alpha crystallin family protein [Candidatus Hinthialibacter antarcticus]|nr:Hsp20/alpha crystallin family protein [Candidatus Hinthialibacter antarcticus]
MTPLNSITSRSRGHRNSHLQPLKIWGQMADFTSQQTAWSPSVDLFEDDRKFVLQFEMPGVHQDDLDIDVYEDAVAVRGKRRFSVDEFSTQTMSWEDDSVSFSRRVLLPALAAVDLAECALSNGVLTLTVPKNESAPLQRIPVAFVE